MEEDKNISHYKQKIKDVLKQWSEYYVFDVIFDKKTETFSYKFLFFLLKYQIDINAM